MASSGRAKTRIQDELEYVLSSIDFIEGQRQNPTLQLHESLLQKYNQKQARLNKDSEKQSRQGDLQQVEQLQKKLLIDEINKIGQSSIHLSLSSELSPKKQAGSQYMTDKKFYEKRFILNAGLRELLENQHCAEVVSIEPLKVDKIAYRQKKSVRKGFLSVGRKKAKYESYIAGQRPKLFSESVLGSDNHEPSYLVEYVFYPTGYDIEDDRQYQDYSGRSGQMMTVSMVLPKHLADKIKNKINTDTEESKRLIRELAKLRLQKSFSDNSIKVDFENSWKNGEKNSGVPLRPLYEAWDKKGVDMYFLDKE